MIGPHEHREAPNDCESVHLADAQDVYLIECFSEVRGQGHHLVGRQDATSPERTACDQQLAIHFLQGSHTSRLTQPTCHSHIYGSAGTLVIQQMREKTQVIIIMLPRHCRELPKNVSRSMPHKHASRIISEYPYVRLVTMPALEGLSCKDRKTLNPSICGSIHLTLAN